MSLAIQICSSSLRYYFEDLLYQASMESLGLVIEQIVVVEDEDILTLFIQMIQNQQKQYEFDEHLVLKNDRWYILI
jgi:hypothetical protein